MILVTGGAGFIGSNFVLDWLASSAEPVVNLDKLTYAGNLRNLAPDAPAFTELHRYEPNSPYSASKAAADHLVRSYHHTYGLPVLTTNCSNNYGPFHFPEKLVPLCILNALAAGRPGETYKIGGWNEQANLDVVRTLCGILDEEQPRADGQSCASQIEFVKDRLGHDRRYAIDAHKLEQELGWRPAETFATGIRKTVRWYLDHRDWVADVTSGGYREWIDRQYAS
ncbi:MAG: GDP-mannose 4,6-dehydratase [Planctomycetota bacterium]